MSLCGFAMLPLSVFAANTLLLDLTRYQSQEDSELKNDKDLEKGKKEETTNGIEVTPVSLIISAALTC